MSLTLDIHDEKSVYYGVVSREESPTTSLSLRAHQGCYQSLSRAKMHFLAEKEASTAHRKV